jgi:hypothetical protein
MSARRSSRSSTVSDVAARLEVLDRDLELLRELPQRLDDGVRAPATIREM